MAESSSLFPEEMMKAKSGELSLETIAGKLSYFFEQTHLLHLQTPSHAEHSALNVWEEIVDAKDEILEKLMGYENKKLKAYKIEPLTDYSFGAPSALMNQLKLFSKQLQNYASSKGFADIENLAQDLSGHAAKTLYLLTQS